MDISLFTIVSTFISTSGEAVLIVAGPDSTVWEFRGSSGLCAPSQESLEVLYE